MRTAMLAGVIGQTLLPGETWQIFGEVCIGFTCGEENELVRVKRLLIIDYLENPEGFIFRTVISARAAVLGSATRGQ